MVDWDSLYPHERSVYIEKAKRLLESGSYVGFAVDELAIFIYRQKEMNR